MADAKNGTQAEERGQRVLEAWFSEAIDFGGTGTKSYLRAAPPPKTNESRVLQLSTTAEMWMDRSRGWVVCRWETTKGKHEYLIPRENCRAIRVECA